MPSIKPFDITLSVIDLLLYQMREAITIVHHDSQGRPICDRYDSLGASRGCGLFGTFDPLSIIDPLMYLPSYDGARSKWLPHSHGGQAGHGADCARRRAATTTWLARPGPFAPGTYTQMSL